MPEVQNALYGKSSSEIAAVEAVGLLFKEL